jgi:hypothetical protein
VPSLPPATHRRRSKRELVAWSRNWTNLSLEDIEGPGLPGWRLDARLTTLLCKKIVSKSKDMKTGSNLTEFSKEGYGSKRAVLPMMIMMKIILHGT